MGQTYDLDIGPVAAEVHKATSVGFASVLRTCGIGMDALERHVLDVLQALVGDSLRTCVWRQCPVPMCAPFPPIPAPQAGEANSGTSRYTVLTALSARSGVPECGPLFPH